MNCHTGYHSLWVNSDHALANRPVDPVRDRPAFASLTQIADGGSRFDVAWNNGRPTLTSPAAGAIPATVHAPDRRMRISGRMADVCAELDRLAAR